jgi:O-antigen/teichoic acid export membrane protein
MLRFLGLISARLTDATSNKIYMAVTTLFRMVVGFGVFVVLAKTLGPSSFGLVTAVFAYAAIAALVTDFGFSTKNLRDIASDPAGGRDILLDTLELKGLLTLVVLAGGLPIIFLLPISLTDRIGAALFAGGVLATSFGGLGAIGLRAIGRFRQEMWITCWTSAAYAICTAMAVVIWPGSIIAIGIAFLFSRGQYAVVAIKAAWNTLDTRVSARKSRFSIALSTATGGTPWAIDNALVVLAAQLDAVLIAHYGTLAQLGIYQAGGRIIENLFSLAVVMAAVHIPLLSRMFSVDTQKSFRSASYKAFFEYVLAGAILGGLIFAAGPWFSEHYFGTAYAPLIPLWPSFAVLLFARFVAGAYGVLLTATGQVGWRIGGQIAGILSIVIVFFFTFRVYGINAMPWIMCAGPTVTSLIYSFAWAISRPPLR